MLFAAEAAIFSNCFDSVVRFLKPAPRRVNSNRFHRLRGGLARARPASPVVVDHMGAARKGLAAAAIQWDDGPNAKLSSADIVRQLEEASRQPGVVARNEGEPEKALASAAQRLEAVYQLPFLAHAAMEPMNCTVHLRKDGCDIWVGTQAPTLTQAVVAELTGLPMDAVKIHNHLLGGGFGRRLDVGGSVLAVKIAQQVDGPVKAVWSREEDIQHDMYRPYYYDRLSAGQEAPPLWVIRVLELHDSARHAMTTLCNISVTKITRSRSMLQLRRVYDKGKLYSSKRSLR